MKRNQQQKIHSEELLSELVVDRDSFEGLISPFSNKGKWLNSRKILNYAEHTVIKKQQSKKQRITNKELQNSKVQT